MYHSHARLWSRPALVLGLGVMSLTVTLGSWYLQPTLYLPSRETVQLYINGIEIEAELAMTTGERARGLAGRTTLPYHRGMLFLFDTPGHYTFWMHGMQFAIDIIWIYEGRVVWIKENALPPTPGMPPEYFTPPDEANEVLEVVAGFVANQHINLGDTVSVIVPKEQSHMVDYYQQS